MKYDMFDIHKLSTEDALKRTQRDAEHKKRAKEVIKIVEFERKSIIKKIEEMKHKDCHIKDGQWCSWCNYLKHEVINLIKEEMSIKA